MPGQGGSHRHFPSRQGGNSVDAEVGDQTVTLTTTSEDGLTVSSVTVEPELLDDLVAWFEAVKQQQLMLLSQLPPDD